ncbi:putative bifunctional diguanylate cyclase/phosphodiesterase, partial [Halorhodospira neutriphila]
ALCRQLAAAEGRDGGLGGLAMRQGRRVLIPDLGQDPRLPPEYEQAAAWGLGAAGAFPIQRGGAVVGSLNLYAADPAFFAEESRTIALFEELVADMGAALDDFDRQEQIHELTYRSLVTGLPNRVSLLERLGQEADRLRRQGGCGGVIHADIDDFKAINDSLGTRAGDEVLRLLAERLTSILRVEDVAAHAGADELVVLIPDLPDESEEAAVEANRLAERVRSALQEPLSLGERSLRVTVSVGVALFPGEDAEGCDPPEAGEEPPGTASERILQQARLALAKAEDEGGDRVRFYDPALRRRAERHLDIGEELRLAQERGELRVVYQPLWELATERVVGLEALLRWHHPERGPISPGEFIPVAERTGQILELGDWILEQVLAQADAWLQRGKAGLPLGLAVNVSPLQFNQDDWGERVLERLSRARVTGRCLKLEVTESLLMANIGTAQAKMADLRTAGVSFALDDFGTGYSSLAYLQELPLDYLKVDRSFVQRIGEARASEGIIEAVLAMAGHLGLRVIAEGVETAEQAAFLRERGCAVGQGFYWSKPLAAEEVEPLLRGGG